MATVFTNGCFDILHPGHIQLLLYCRYLAKEDPVYVAIDSDAKAQRDKGPKRPYYSQSERLDLLLMLTIDGKLNHPRLDGNYIIDWVDVFDTDKELYEIIKKRQPDYIVKGEDWRDKYVVGSDIASVHFAPTYYKDWFSTTRIEQRILDKWNKK